MDKINIKEAISYAGAERAILSICLNDQDKLVECEQAGLKPEHFSVDGHKYIYATIAYLFSNPSVKKIDGIAILNTLPDEKAKQSIEDLGGIRYIDLLTQTSIADNVTLYTNKVKQAYVRRQIYLKGQEFQDRAISDEQMNAEEFLESIQKDILHLVLTNENAKEVYKMGTDLGERLTERATNPTDVPGYRVGWRKFDKATQGYKPGELTVFVAPSKVGKSTLLLNHARALSVDSHVPVLYINTEMNDVEMEDRLVANLSGVDYEEITNGMFAVNTSIGIATNKIEAIRQAQSCIEEAPFYHIYMPDFTIEKVTALAKKMQLQYNIGVLIFDYIKLPTSEVGGLANAQEYQRLGYMTTCLKDLAGILDIPVITAAQTNQSGETETAPSAKTIGGSYRILQMASKLFFLRNKSDEELARDGLDNGNQVLHLAYQRSGASNIAPINLYAERNILRMSEV